MTPEPATTADSIVDAGIEAWALAVQVAEIAAVCGARIGGVQVRSWASPARDRWLELLRDLLPPEERWVVVHPEVDDTRLQGGIDLGATLGTGKPSYDSGLIAAADGGVLLIRMAERLFDRQLGTINAALDEGQHRIERDGLSAVVPARFLTVALDESLPDEPLLAASLAERLALVVDLNSIPLAALSLTHEFAAADAAQVAVARARLAAVTVPEQLLPALCQTARAAGIESLRPPLQALRAAAALAALGNAEAVERAHAELAVRLVYGPRARVAPEPAEDAAPPESEPAEDPDPDAAPEEDRADGDTDESETLPDLNDLAEILLAALPAALPEQLLSRPLSGMRVRTEGATGRSGPRRRSFQRGAPLSPLPGVPDGRRRLDLPATLRRAAPWQPLRRDRAAMQGRSAAGEPDRVLIENDDLTVKRFTQQAAVVTIFLVDASGSQAMQRLGEVKGAVERLLAECYVRRDEVALVSFRGAQAELLLPPTRSLVRAKRSLAALPGGGGTPLASGLKLGLAQAQRVQRSGAVPLLVLLCDGRPNVTLAGTGGRAQAAEEATALARAIAALAVPLLVVDTSMRGQAFLADLAQDAEGAYERLPNVDSATLSAEVQRLGQGLRKAQ